MNVERNLCVCGIVLVAIVIFREELMDICMKHTAIILLLFVLLSIAIVAFLIYCNVTYGKDLVEVINRVYVEVECGYKCGYCGSTEQFRVSNDKHVVICRKCGRSNSYGGIEKLDT